jgi:hypothetical protein
MSHSLGLGTWDTSNPSFRVKTSELSASEVVVPVSEQKIPAQFPDIFARGSRKAAKSKLIYGLRRNRGGSLLNPCLRRKFADSGQNLKNHLINGEKSLINSLVQGNWQVMDQVRADPDKESVPIAPRHFG